MICFGTASRFSDFPSSIYAALSILIALCFYFIFRSGFRNHVALASCLFIYFLYIVVVPVSDAWLLVNSYFGFQFEPDAQLDTEISTIYLFGILSLLSGYFLAQRFFLKRILIPEFDATDLKTVLSSLNFMQYAIWFLILLNIYFSGVSISRLLDFGNQSEKDILFSIDWRIPGIDLLTNCLSVILFLLFWFRKRITVGWVFFVSIWLIFCLLAGWRYRIILFMLFFLCYAIKERELALKWLVSISLVLSICVAWITLNRMAIAKRQFDVITFDLRQFKFQIFTNELSNSRTFKATLQYLRKNNIPPPGTQSWVDYVANKFLAKHRFAENERPKPWIITITKAWIPPGWPWNPNPAVNQMEEFYLTFRWKGLAIGMFIMGLWVALLDMPSGNMLFRAFQLVGIGLCFQLISRGFFLYQAQIVLASLLPFLVLLLVKAYLPLPSNADKIRSIQ